MLDWLLFLGITVGGAMIPGANFAVVLRNTLNGSRRSGLLTVCGLATALMIHGTLTLLGISALIQNSPAAFEVIRWLGAAYLILLGGWQLLQRQPAAENSAPNHNGGSPFIAGLLISLFNPKVLVFFLAIFSQVLSPEQSLATKLLYVATPALAEISWFMLVLALLGTPAIRQWLMRVKSKLERFLGGAMVALGIKIGLG